LVIFMIIVSACLVEINCRYDGGNSRNDSMFALLEQGKAVPVCPEQLGGLPTPRPRSEIEHGDGEDVFEGKAKITDETGKDVTENFIRGADETLKIIRLVKAKKAFLKEKSPSCGVKYIKRQGELIEGCGVTAFLLNQEGIEIIGV